MTDGGWRTENGERRTESGEQRMANAGCLFATRSSRLIVQHGVQWTGAQVGGYAARRPPRPRRGRRPAPRRHLKLEPQSGQRACVRNALNRQGRGSPVFLGGGELCYLCFQTGALHRGLMTGQDDNPGDERAAHQQHEVSKPWNLVFHRCDAVRMTLPASRRPLGAEPREENQASPAVGNSDTFVNFNGHVETFLQTFFQTIDTHSRFFEKTG